jgi:hypothetical protein
MIRKLSLGQYRLYSRKKNPRTGRRRNLGTFRSRAAALAHERAVQFFKQRGQARKVETGILFSPRKPRRKKNPGFDFSVVMFAA